MIARNLRLKRFAGGVILLAVALLLTFTLTNKATADTKLAASVVASSGGEASSTNFVVRSTLGQSTPIGHSASTNFGLGAGFWYQDPIPPSAIGDLKAILSDRSVDDIYLEWSHAKDNVAIDYYVVYRATKPYFEPTPGDSISGTKGATYLDSGAAGDTLTNYFYVVKATDPSKNLAEDSNRVGEFDKYLSSLQWHIISWPLLPHDTDIHFAFADSLGTGCQLTGGFPPCISDKVLYFDAATGLWSTGWYDSSLNVWKGPLSTIEPDKGYWIFIEDGHPSVTLTMTGDVSETSRIIPIQPGLSYNHVGTAFAIPCSLGGQSGDDAGLVASGVTENDKVLYFDGTLWQLAWYSSMASEWVGSLESLEPGNGYIVVLQDGHAFHNNEWHYPIPPDYGLKGDRDILLAKNRSGMKGETSKRGSMPTACFCYGGMEEDGDYWSLLDFSGDPLEPGDWIYIAWTGPDGQIDLPDLTGFPTDDDFLLLEGMIDWGPTSGTFFITATVSGMGDGHPESGDLIYCRIFDGPKGSLGSDNYYGDSQTYECLNALGREFYCLYPGDPGSGHTDSPLDKPPEAIDDLSVALESGAKSTTGDMRLWWSEPNDDLGVVRYVVYRSTASGSLGDSLAGTTDTTYLDVGAAGDVGTNYFYIVKAVDGAGQKSDDSNEVGEFDAVLINGAK